MDHIEINAVSGWSDVEIDYTGSCDDVIGIMFHPLCLQTVHKSDRNNTIGSVHSATAESVVPTSVLCIVSFIIYTVEPEIDVDHRSFVRVQQQQERIGSLISFS